MSASARPRPGVVDICDPRAQTARRSLTRTRILGSECLSSLQFTELTFSIPAKRNPDTSFGIPSLTESPRAASRSSGVARSGCGDDCCDRHSELTDVGARPEFTLFESQVSTPRYKPNGARRGFFFAESASLGIVGVRPSAARPQRLWSRRSRGVPSNAFAASRLLRTVVAQFDSVWKSTKRS
jgi:hypothetical protein